MKLFAVVVVGLLLALAVADPWKNCGVDKDHLKIQSLKVDPQVLTPGQPVTVEFNGDLDETISGGTVHFDVYYLGIKILSKTYGNCDFAEVPCPIQPGKMTYKLTETIPKATPRGTYTGKVQAVDQKGEEIACLTFNVKVSVGLDDLVVDTNMVDFVNADPTSTWKAGVNEPFSGMTVREAQKLLGAHVNAKATMPELVYSVGDLPKDFDSRTQWPVCAHAIRDQGHCGSCWAFALSEVMSDRFCIATSGGMTENLSPQYIVSCDKSDLACQGGYLDRSWNFVVNQGTVTEKCDPYTSGGGAVEACRTTCAAGGDLKFFKIKAGTVENPTALPTVQTSLMKNGPVEAAFQVYQDFMSYKSGVYQHKSGSLLGGHAVKCLGWGVENNVNYWLMANSWGPSWGDKGYFKIIRGKNDCLVDSNLWYGLPTI